VLQELLKQKGIKCSHQQIAAACEHLGVDEEALTLEQATIVVEYLSQQAGKITKATKTGKMSRANKRDRTPTPGEAIANASAQVNDEIEAFKQGVTSALDISAQQHAEDLMARIAHQPNVVIENLASIASNYEGDTEFFRAYGQTFGSALVGFVPADET